MELPELFLAARGVPKRSEVEKPDLHDASL
jgi:hypothetical protein